MRWEQASSFPCQMAIAFHGGVLPDLEATLRALKRWEHEHGGVAPAAAAVNTFRSLVQ